MTQSEQDQRYRGLRVLEVLRTEHLTARMRRLVLGGVELEGFGFGPNLKLLFPPAGTAPQWPRQGADGRPVWLEPRPVVRTYSVRRFDAARGELWVDFVLHGAGGVASAFAERARPGDLVGVGGPGGRTLPAADFHLLAGDHSGLPSIAATLEAMDPSARGLALIEVPDAGEEQIINAPAGVEVRWLHRDGTAAGSTTALVDAVRALPWPDAGSVSAWIAAESASARALRAYLKAERRLPPRALVAVGYWKLGFSEADYQAAHDHDRDADYHSVAREEAGAS